MRLPPPAAPTSSPPSQESTAPRWRSSFAWRGLLPFSFDPDSRSGGIGFDRQRFFERPSVPNSRPYQFVRTPQTSGPLGQMKALATKLVEDVPPRVLHLIHARRPNAVVGRVGARIVFALDSVFRRGARAHVFQERFEDAPSLAQLDAAAPVVLRAFDIRIGASRLDVAPRPVLGATSHAVPRRTLGRDFSRETPTRKRPPAPDRSFEDLDLLAAGALVSRDGLTGGTLSLEPSHVR